VFNPKDGINPIQAQLTLFRALEATAEYCHDLHPRTSRPTAVSHGVFHYPAGHIIKPSGLRSGGVQFVGHEVAKHDQPTGLAYFSSILKRMCGVGCHEARNCRNHDMPDGVIRIECPSRYVLGFAAVSPSACFTGQVIDEGNWFLCSARAERRGGCREQRA
jgi:hypothetical protein